MIIAVEQPPSVVPNENDSNITLTTTTNIMDMDININETGNNDSCINNKSIQQRQHSFGLRPKNQLQLGSGGGIAFEPVPVESPSHSRQRALTAPDVVSLLSVEALATESAPAVVTPQDFDDDDNFHLNGSSPTINKRRRTSSIDVPPATASVTTIMTEETTATLNNRRMNRNELPLHQQRQQQQQHPQQQTRPIRMYSEDFTTTAMTRNRNTDNNSRKSFTFSSNSYDLEDLPSSTERYSTSPSSLINNAASAPEEAFSTTGKMQQQTTTVAIEEKSRRGESNESDGSELMLEADGSTLQDAMKEAAVGSSQESEHKPNSNNINNNKDINTLNKLINSELEWSNEEDIVSVEQQEESLAAVEAASQQRQRNSSIINSDIGNNNNVVQFSQNSSQQLQQQPHTVPRDDNNDQQQQHQKQHYQQRKNSSISESHIENDDVATIDTHTNEDAEYKNNSNGYTNAMIVATEETTPTEQQQLALEQEQHFHIDGANLVDDIYGDVQNRPLFRLLIDYLRYRPWKKKLLTLIVVASVVLVFLDFFTTGYIRTGLEGFLRWMNDHTIAGFFIFIGLFVVTTLVFIPPSILTFGAGYVFADIYGAGAGIFVATAASFIGSFIGAIIAFFRARYMMRDLIKLFARKYPIIRAADKALKRKGFRVMLLLRLCWLIPFNAINYICGITGVKWEAYTLALVGMLPSQILTVAIGASASGIREERGEEEQEIVKKVSAGVGIGLGFVAVVITWYFARKEFYKELAIQRELDKEEQESIAAESIKGDAVVDDVGIIDAEYGIGDGIHRDDPILDRYSHNVGNNSPNIARNNSSSNIDIDDNNNDTNSTSRDEDDSSTSTSSTTGGHHDDKKKNKKKKKVRKERISSGTYTSSVRDVRDISQYDVGDIHHQRRRRSSSQESFDDKEWFWIWA